MSQNPPWPLPGEGDPQNPQRGNFPPQYPPPGAGYSGPFAGQPQGGYPGQGSGGGYQPPPGGSGGDPAGGSSPRKSTGMIIGIVVAAVVLLVAVGGIIMALSGGDDDQPVTTITPSAPPTPAPVPTTEPTEEPTEEPSGGPTSSEPTQDTTEAPSGEAIDLGSGVTLTPAPDWQVRSKQQSAAQLANGRDIFLGIVATLPQGSNPAQTCDGYHRELAKEYTNGKFAEPKKVDLGTTNLTGATCMAQVTVANGGNALTVLIYSLVSVRADGLTVVGSLYFTEDSDVDALNQDFSAMVNSMLRTQAAGG